VKSVFIISLTGLLLATAAARAAETKKAEGDEEVTVITSDKLTADYKQHFALFEGNVFVTDPQMQLTSEKLNVTFDTNNKIKAIRAEGKVNIRQTD
jgi:lipopolysaccharide transport protein LptA